MIILYTVLTYIIWKFGYQTQLEFVLRCRSKQYFETAVMLELPDTYVFLTNNLPLLKDLVIHAETATYD